MNLTEVVKIGLLGVKPNEALTLVKNGYTAESIQELMNSESDDQHDDNASGADEGAAGTQNDNKNDVSEDDQKKSEESHAEDTSEKDKEIERLKAELLKAQEENTRKSMESETKSNDELVRDIITDFMQ